MPSSPLKDARAGTDIAPELFRFVVPGKLEYRDAAKAFLSYVCNRLARRGGVPQDVAHRVVSAFVEAFNNAAIHAYRDMPPGQVDVEMEVHEYTLRVKVTDTGRSFEPAHVPEPDLDALPEGGLGLFIIRNFMDDVRYDRVADRNVLTMEKTFEPSIGESAGDEG